MRHPIPRAWSLEPGAWSLEPGFRSVMLLGALMGVVLLSLPHAAWSAGTEGSGSGTGGGGGSSGSGWVPYGYVIPGDPELSFVYNSSETGTFGNYGGSYFPGSANEVRGFFGAFVRGNIVIGDYTTNAAESFDDQALPLLDGSGNPGHSAPYAIDPNDEQLGYDTGTPPPGDTRDWFNGNYDQQDKYWDPATQNALPALKSDNTPRKFYESSLGDAEFRDLVSNTGNVHIDGAFFTNHAVAAFLPGDGTSMFRGSLVARDDAIVFHNNSQAARGSFLHDLRLLDPESLDMLMPLTLKRDSTLVSWQECSDETPCN